MPIERNIKMNTELNILICGVGGQGTLLASRLLGEVLKEQGLDVKVSEVHGMSQRGGSVVTYVRSGQKVYSPIIEKGGADIILAFEQLEAARWLPYLKKGGRLVMNTGSIEPMPVITGAMEYPEGIVDKINKLGVNLTTIDALSPAIDAGSAKAVNVVLIGALSRFMQLGHECWQAAIKRTVPERFQAMNLTAFNSGAESVPQ